MSIDWSDASCASVGLGAADEWHPDKGGSTRQAKRICEGCPLRDACLNYALTEGMTAGVWGGLSAKERQALGVPKPKHERPINHGTEGRIVSANLSAAERAAEVLDAHGWRPSPDGDAWVEHARHQADALAAEGLLTVREQVAREIEAAAQTPGVSGPERYALSVAAHIARGGAA